MDSELKKGTISLSHAASNGLSANGPAAVTALYFVGVAGIVGGATPLVLLLAFLIYVGMSVVMYEWSKIVASANPWGAIQKRGWGSWGAVFATVTYWYNYTVGFIVGFAALGFAAFAYLLFPAVGATYPWLWAPISVIIILETSAFVYFGIKISTKYLLWTAVAEIGFIILTSIALIIFAGHANTLTVFTPKPIKNDWVIILVSMVLAIDSFGGMNSVIPVAEETKDPKRNIPKAIILVAILLGGSILISSYAQTVIFGPSNMFAYSSLPDPGLIIYSKYFGPIITALLAIFVLNSFNNSGIAAGNNGVRTAYRAAKEGLVFPKMFSRINNKYGTPGMNVWITALIMISVDLVSGFLIGPLDAALLLVITGGVANYLNHSLASIGLLKYHYRMHTLKLVRHILIPLVVTVSLLVAIVFDFYPAPAPPLNFGSYIIAVLILVFLIIYFVNRRKYPDKLKSFGDFSM